MPPTSNPLPKGGVRSLSQKEFEKLGTQMMLPTKKGRAKALQGSKKKQHRRFQSWFGTQPSIISIIWERLITYGWLIKTVKIPNPIHLLWALHFLQTYNTESMLSATVGGVHPDTFRKWSWHYIQGISYLANTIVSYIDFCFELLLSIDKSLSPILPFLLQFSDKMD